MQCFVLLHVPSFFPPHLEIRAACFRIKRIRPQASHSFLSALEQLARRPKGNRLNVSLRGKSGLLRLHSSFQVGGGEEDSPCLPNSWKDAFRCNCFSLLTALLLFSPFHRVLLHSFHCFPLLDKWLSEVGVLPRLSTSSTYSQVSKT